MASIENVIPILRVEDLEVSRRYCIQELGFALDWDYAGKMISVLARSQGDEGQPKLRDRCVISQCRCT